jgi:hypothetical protein
MTQETTTLLRDNAERLQQASNAYNAECETGTPSVATVEAMRDALDAVAAELWRASERS